MTSNYAIHARPGDGRRAHGGAFAAAEGNRPVLMVGNFLSSTLGTRGVCEDLADRLTAAGCTVIRTSHRRERAARLRDMLETAWGKRHDYAAAQVDVYSGLAFAWAEAVCWILRRAGKPYVLTLHGGGLPDFARRWPRRVRRLLGSAAAVTTPSRYLLEQLLHYHDGLRLLPNPLDIAAYRFVRREKARPRLVWLRAFHEIYNPSLAPQVLNLLVDDFADASLTMFGPDKGDGSLAKTRGTAVALGVSERVETPGAVPKAEVARRLGGGDIFLNTTDVDNTPVSVMEAMACGLCIVSTNVGGIPYLLEDGHDALLVPPGDSAAMAAAVRRVLTEPGLAARLSQNARRKAETFDWAVVLPQWTSLLDRVAPGVN